MKAIKRWFKLPVTRLIVTTLRGEINAGKQPA